MPALLAMLTVYEEVWVGEAWRLGVADEETGGEVVAAAVVETAAEVAGVDEGELYVVEQALKMITMTATITPANNSLPSRNEFSFIMDLL